MKKYNVMISADAIDDLRDIYTYIAYSLNAKQAAANLVDKIRQKISEPESFPLRHKLVEWEPWASMNIHHFPVNNYEIFFSVDQNSATVSIVRIFYGGRNIEQIIKS